MKNSIIISGVLILLIGCGVMAQPKKEEPEKLNIPQKISIEIPNTLNPDLNSSQPYQKIKIDKAEGYAQGYDNITGYIRMLEYVISKIKSSLLFADESMLEIQTKCQNTPLNQVCTIPSEEINTTITAKMIEQLNVLLQIDTELDSNFTVGEKVSFGAIEFAKYTNNPTYDYSLSLDITKLHEKIYANQETPATKVMQVIQWSDDNNTIFSSIYQYYNDEEQMAWTINYQNETEQERMYLYNTEYDAFPLPQTSNNFTLVKLHDLNNTYRAKYNSVYEDYSYGLGIRVPSKFGSYTEITNNNGYQRYNYTEVYDGNEYLYKEDSIFNNLGELLALTYCHQSDEQCSLSDESSWYSDAEDEHIFDPIASMPIDFIQLKVTEGNLENGAYFLLPSDVNLSSA